MRLSSPMPGNERIYMFINLINVQILEPVREKTNNLGSDQV